jgi:hypothetical protein
MAAVLFLANFRTVAQKKKDRMIIEQRNFIIKKQHKSHHILRDKKS